MKVIPRSSQETLECTNCGWQGTINQTDSGHCQECAGECLPINQIYGEEEREH